MRAYWHDEEVPVHFALPVHRHPECVLRRRAMLSCIFLVVVMIVACVSAIRFATAASSPAFSVVPDTRSLIPTVLITGIENGELIGEIRGDVRLFLGNRQIIPNGSGAFRVPAGELKTDVRTIPVPEGMRFVASKKGKRYYPVHAKQAEGLAPKNRIYFETVEEAKAAGYR